MSRAREVSKIVATVDSVENSIDNIDLSSTIITASAAAVSYLVDGAPEALNTLNELSAALSDDQDFATTVTNELSNKLSIASASSTYLTQASASSTYSSQAYAQLNKIAGFTIAANTYTTVALDESLYAKNISLSSGNIVFALPGTYAITLGFRFGGGSDVWTGCRLYGDGATRGSSFGTGNIANDPGPVTFSFMAQITNTSAEYSLQVYRLASTLAVATPNTGAGRAFVCTVTKVD